jgi:hypothetical protein
MKRFVLSLLSYVIFFLGLFAGLIAVLAFINPKRDEFNLHYFFGGAAVIGFVVSWLLLKIARRK